MFAAYLANRFIYRITAFLRHWYVDSFWWASRQAVNALESLDRRFALRITLRNFFKPLYQDYTIIGHILGIFFRFWRVIFAALLYAVLIVAVTACYIAWALLPIAVPVALYIG